MTEKIKAKNADVICALVNGETVQVRSLCRNCPDLPKGIWVNVTLAFDEYTLMINVNTRYSFELLWDDEWEFRLKHPHQDLIDQIEANPSLEQYLQVDQGRDWEPITLRELKYYFGAGSSGIVRIFRINKPAHQHQKLIDLIESWNVMLPCYMAVTGGWPPVRYICRQDMIKVLIDNPEDSFQIFTIAGESKGIPNG
jgi:hypothetical protein